MAKSLEKKKSTMEASSALNPACRALSDDEETLSGNSSKSSSDSPSKEDDKTPLLMIQNINEIPTGKAKNKMSMDTCIFSNVKEKIIFVIDCCVDKESKSFHTKGVTFQTLTAFKRAIDMFVNLKKDINNKHVYAVAAMRELKIEWITDFTNNLKELLRAVNRLQTCRTEDIINIDLFFEELTKKVEIPPRGTEGIPPPYIVRAIFLYNRVYTILSINLEIAEMFSAYYLFFDFIISFAGDQKMFKSAMEEFKVLDRKNKSLFIPVGKNLNNLLVGMAKLLSHPLQRCMLTPR